ncbi:MAG: HAD family hydrolase [Tannerella sp.]|jgi:putative hydrolase of the HAD superfamily|nr:HAD family hydrolase [Tannerella sp.]
MTLHPDRIGGIVFDYGGTIDSNGVHWSEVLRHVFSRAQAPVAKEAFREAYVHGERTLGTHPLVQPHHTFLDVLRLKADLQVEWLRAHRALTAEQATPALKRQIAAYGYACARRSVEAARPVIAALAEQYPLALVTNFYGNMASVLNDFGLDAFFPILIESAVCGVRKPDPQIFGLALEALHLPAGKVAVIGDSYGKDILPAASLGCKTVWLKNTGWQTYTGNETADVIISGFEELKTVFGIPQNTLLLQERKKTWTDQSEIR